MAEAKNKALFASLEYPQGRSESRRYPVVVLRHDLLFLVDQVDSVLSSKSAKRKLIRSGAVPLQ